MTFSACACSRSAFVGMQPQIRQVPPSAFCFSTTATFLPSCAARIAPTYPPVPAPITTTSYELAKSRNSESTLEGGQRDERLGLCRGIVRQRSRRAGTRELLHLRPQLAVLIFQLPIHLGQLREATRTPPRQHPGRDRHRQRGSRHGPREDHG